MDDFYSTKRMMKSICKLGFSFRGNTPDCMGVPSRLARKGLGELLPPHVCVEVSRIRRCTSKRP
eukprot:4254409-Prorocentrum_lima.AAC.1